MCRLLEQAIRAGRPVAWLGDPAATPVDLDGGPLAALDAQDDAGVSGWLAACLATEARTIAAE
jgi:hypothetical protein